MRNNVLIYLRNGKIKEITYRALSLFQFNKKTAAFIFSLNDKIIFNYQFHVWSL